MSNLGRLAGSSFMQIFMSLHTWGEMPGGIVGRRPSRATCKYREEQGGSQNLIVMGREANSPQERITIRGKSPASCQPSPNTSVYSCVLTFIPISMLERSAKGTSRVTSSHRSTAKLHMSAERLFVSSGFFCRAGGTGLICSVSCPLSPSITTELALLYFLT